MDEQLLLKRIPVNPNIFGGKPIVRGRQLAVEHVLGMWGMRDMSVNRSLQSFGVYPGFVRAN